MVASPEELAYLHRWIGAEELLALAHPLAKTAYGRYLRSLVP